MFILWTPAPFSPNRATLCLSRTPALPLSLSQLEAIAISGVPTKIEADFLFQKPAECLFGPIFRLFPLLQFLSTPNCVTSAQGIGKGGCESGPAGRFHARPRALNELSNFGAQKVYWTVRKKFVPLPWIPSVFFGGRGPMFLFISRNRRAGQCRLD